MKLYLHKSFHFLINNIRTCYGGRKFQVSLFMNYSTFIIKYFLSNPFLWIDVFLKHIGIPITLVVAKTCFFGKGTPNPKYLCEKFVYQNQSRNYTHSQLSLCKSKVNQQFKIYLLHITTTLYCLPNTVNGKLMITRPSWK